MTKLFIVLSFIANNPGLTLKELQSFLGKEVNKNTIDNYTSSFYGYTLKNRWSDGYGDYLGKPNPEYIEVRYDYSRNNSLGRKVKVRKFYITELGKEKIEFDLNKEMNVNF